jgi:ectoine hydroxylase-related dioxygenase (phytanoyl-CoA dioxygenase family)
MSVVPRVSDDDIHAFWRDGVVCLRAVLPRELLEAMADPVEAARRSAQSADLGALAAAAGAATPGRFIAGTDHWRHQEELRAFAQEPPLPGLVAALLRSRRVFLYEDSVLVKEPGAEAHTLWHQDLGYFHVEGTQLCTTWCPLDPATPATGAMRFVRGSHRWGRLFRPHLFVDSTALPGTEGEEVPDIDAGHHDIVTFDLEPGDITVHHAATLHAAGPNTSTTTRRRAISVRYCGDDARFRRRPGAPLKPEQAALVDGAPLGGPVHPRVH